MTAYRLAVLSLLLGAAVARATDPATICRTDKMLAAGVYDLCLLRAEAKAAKTGRPLDVSRCTAKLVAHWSRAEAKASAACPTTGDRDAIAGRVQGDVAGVVAALTPAATTTTTPTPPTTSSTVPGPTCGTFPGCGGVCPSGQSCWAVVLAGPTTTCTCLAETATPCGSTGGSLASGSMCGGACPAGQVCSTIHVDESLDFTCGCIPAGSSPCLTFSGPCGGACPAGMSCTATPTGLFGCMCQ